MTYRGHIGWTSSKLIKRIIRLVVLESGLGLKVLFAGLGLGLGLEDSGLGLALGLESYGLGLGLGLGGSASKSFFQVLFCAYTN